MSGFLSQVPPVFKASAATSACLVTVAAMVAGYVKDCVFGLQTAIAGGFSVALLCAYVVWVSAVMARAKAHVQADKGGEYAASVGAKIQVASLVKLFVLASVLVILIVVFHFDVIAAIIGVSGIYLPLAIVPLFVKPDRTYRPDTPEEHLGD